LFDAGEISGRQNGGFVGGTDRSERGRELGGALDQLAIEGFELVLGALARAPLPCGASTSASVDLMMKSNRPE